MNNSKKNEGMFKKGRTVIVFYLAEEQKTKTEPKSPYFI